MSIHIKTGKTLVKWIMLAQCEDAWHGGLRLEERRTASELGTFFKYGRFIRFDPRSLPDLTLLRNQYQEKVNSDCSAELIYGPAPSDPPTLQDQFTSSGER